MNSHYNERTFVHFLYHHILIFCVPFPFLKSSIEVFIVSCNKLIIFNTVPESPVVLSRVHCCTVPVPPVVLSTCPLSY